MVFGEVPGISRIRRRKRAGSSSILPDTTSIEENGLSVAVDELFSGIQSPWLRDRVTLSLEAQIAMIEMRATYTLTAVDLGYVSSNNVIELRRGIHLRREPTGCYRVKYGNK